MKKLFNICILLSSVLVANVYAGPHYLSGNIKDLTSNTSGLMIMLDTGVPDNCAGVSANWMTIEKENTAMISVALTMWATGKKLGVVYTETRTDGSCIINQLDPSN